MILCLFHLVIHWLQVILRDVSHYRAQFIDQRDDLPDLFESLLRVGSDSWVMGVCDGFQKHLVGLALGKAKLASDHFPVLSICLQSSGFAHFVVDGEFGDSACRIFRSVLRDVLVCLLVLDD